MRKHNIFRRTQKSRSSFFLIILFFISLLVLSAVFTGPNIGESTHRPFAEYKVLIQEVSDVISANLSPRSKAY